MEYITQNWFNIVGILIIVIGAAIAVKKYLDKDKAQKIEAIKEWLKYAVTVTEKALGAKTGELKLMMAWSMATAQFSFITKVMTFEEFSEHVKEALKWMEKKLADNPNIKAAILGAQKTEVQ